MIFVNCIGLTIMIDKRNKEVIIQNRAGSCRQWAGMILSPGGTQGNMAQLFRKAKQNRIFQDVVEQIQDAILDGKIEPGEKLPSERELGEMLGTSRGTLREALRILEQKGLIEIRLGVNGGAIIKETNWEQMSETLALLIRSQSVSLEHLSEFRQGVEGIVASLAAERASAEDIAELNDLMGEVESFYNKGISHWNSFVRADEKIHIALARISGNPLYRFVIGTIHDNIHRYYDKFLSGGETELEDNYQDLVELVNAISNRQVNEAGLLAREHVRRFNRHMDKKRK
jgi:GntR family transcriptional regulator, transcriptional repressor for pyruvate dehydrogenase complex